MSWPDPCAGGGSTTIPITSGSSAAKSTDGGAKGWHTGEHVHLNASVRAVGGEQDRPQPGQDRAGRGPTSEKAALDPGPRPGRAAGRRPQGASSRAAPRYRVRGSVLPEPRRVLRARHRDVHGHGRALHPPVPVLRRGPRAPQSPRPGGAAPPRDRGGPHGSPARRHHLRGPRRPPRRRGRALRVVRARGEGAGALDPHRDPRPRFPGPDGAGPRSARRRPAGRVQPQPRNRAPALPEGSPGGGLRLVARSPPALRRGPSGGADQVRAHGRGRGRRTRRSWK